MHYKSINFHPLFSTNFWTCSIGFFGVLFFYYRRRKYNQKLQLINKQLLHSNKLLNHSNENIKITNRQLDKANEELKINNQSLKHFANMAAHDLKAPLRTIGAFHQIILNKYLDKISKPDQEIFQIIHHDTASLRQLIDDLLTFAKIDKNLPPAQEVDLNKVVQNVISQLNNDIMEKSATFNIQNLPLVKGHSSLFLQVFLNTINNSLKFSKKGLPPVIDIGYKMLDQETIQIWIRDNGIGIKKDLLNDIFNPFVKLHSKATYEGSGIGLATCKKVIKFYQGKTWAESEFEKGTTIFFNLPIAITQTSLMEPSNFISQL